MTTTSHFCFARKQSSSQFSPLLSSLVSWDQLLFPLLRCAVSTNKNFYETETLVSHPKVGLTSESFFTLPPISQKRANHYPDLENDISLLLCTKTIFFSVFSFTQLSSAEISSYLHCCAVQPVLIKISMRLKAFNLFMTSEPLKYWNLNSPNLCLDSF